MLERWHEIPPTAGLPLIWRDFLPTHVPPLNNALAQYLRLPEVQIECSGTAAFIVALTALHRRHGRRKVVIPAYSCPLVPLAIAHCQLEPVLCDTQPDGFDFDHEALARLCDIDTLAIVPTHLGGRVAALAPVKEIAARTGAMVIEDAAQALGARVNGQAVGSLGDVGFWSLAVGKGLTLYEGGVLFARDAGLREQLRKTAAEMANRSVIWESRRSLELLGYWALYRPFGMHLAYGRPLRRALRRSDPVSAVGDDLAGAIPLHRVGPWRQAIGARALTRLADFQQSLATLAAQRKVALKQVPGVDVLDDPAGVAGTWPFFMVRMPTARSRDAALARLWTAGLGVSRLFIHALPDYDYLARYFPGAQVPNARDFAARMLTVSNSPMLDESGFARVVSALADAASQG